MSNTKRLAALILAAGQSSRMGEPKQLLPWRGRSLVAHAVEQTAALGLESVFVVVGAHAEAVRAELARAESVVPVIVENPGWASGIGSSIAQGVRTIMAAVPHVDGILVQLCDQPILSLPDLGELVDRFDHTVSPLIAASYGGSAGVPAVFGRGFFGELLGLRGDQGAKTVLARYQHKLVTIELPQASHDIDTPAQYRALAGVADARP